MDLIGDVYDPEVSATLALRHPVTNEPLLGDDGKPVTIDIWGPDSQTFKLAMRRLSNVLLNRKEGDDSDLDKQEIEALASVTKGWSDNFSVAKEKLQPSPSNAKKLYKRASWIQEQVRKFAQERENFIKASAKS